MAPPLPPTPRPLNLLYSSPRRTSWKRDFDEAQRWPRAHALGNPHTWQRVGLPPGEAELDALSFTRALDFGRRRPYRRRQAEPKSTVHWGQRKLLLSELEFLSTYAGRDAPVTVVYAGAAPGDHVGLLLELFPRASFHLFDSRPFASALLQRGVAERVRTYQRYFDDADAQYFGPAGAFSRGDGGAQRILFLSDIRSGDPRQNVDFDALLERDLASQMRWTRLMRPHKAMLKFRLSYSQGTTEYLDGELLLPVWGPQTTTECRLVTDAEQGMRRYCHVEFNEAMVFFQTIQRVSIYAQDVGAKTPDGEGDAQNALAMRACMASRGLCHCYDCAAEVAIARQFLRQCCRNGGDGEGREGDVAGAGEDGAALDLIDRFTRWCRAQETKRTLLSTLPPPAKRRCVPQREEAEC